MTRSCPLYAHGLTVLEPLAGGSNARRDPSALKWKMQNLLALKSKNSKDFELQNTELLRRFDRN